ncbi:MAG: hypothetical protein FJ098_15685, partial [Deltaproteobacteria bacterium]|nr:hypothetical protein [Deltaproteobacteria bacterium]
MKGGPPDRRGTPALEGRTLAAGEATRTLVARLLGLDSLPGPSPVCSAAWVEHALEAGVAVEGSEGVV